MSANVRGILIQYVDSSRNKVYRFCAYFLRILLGLGQMFACDYETCNLQKNILLKILGSVGSHICRYQNIMSTLHLIALVQKCVPY